MAELFSTQAADRTQECVQAFRRNPPPARPPPIGPAPGNRSCVRGILLSDLPSDGQADMAITALFNDTTIQEIEIVGDVAGTVGGTFTVSFKGQTTDSLKWNISPDDLQTALQKLETIGQKNVTVALGNAKYQNVDADPDADPTQEFPGLWLVSFVGVFAGRTDTPLMTVTSSLTGGLSMMVSSTTHWGDTGVVETANAVIPVGDPTPMRAGAVVLCHWMPGVGFVVGSVECRDFHIPYGIY